MAALLGACSNTQQAETQKKLDEMEKKLAETEKKLEEGKRAVEATAAEAIDSAKSSAAKTVERTKADAKKATDATQSAIAQNKADIGQNKSAIEANKGAIEANKGAIEANKGAIEANKGAIKAVDAKAEEAKRMAAPAPFHTLAAGTNIRVRTTNKLSTKTAADGSTFEATLEEALVDGGYTIAAKGATVEGVVTSADPGGRVKGTASMTVALRSVIMEDGRRLPIKTSAYTVEAKGGAGKDAAKVGVATGIGAAIGAIAGGGKGAAIGAGAGAAGGTGMVLGTRGAAAEIGSETVLTFRLTQDAKVQELKR
jgi:hypothetical protein